MAKEAKRSKAGRDAQVVALYLIGSPHANMIGLYHLPLLYVMEEVGITEAALWAAFDLLASERIGFAKYDRESGFVWVLEMARYQILGPSDEALKTTDHRVTGIGRCYRSVADNPFLGEFFDRYGDAFHLESRRAFKGSSKGLGRGGEGACSALSLNLGLLEIRGDGRGDGQPSPAIAPVTMEWVVMRWNEIGGVVTVGEIGKGMETERTLRARIGEHPDREWWDRVFAIVSASDFLAGRAKDWSASLTWAMRPKNLAKILAGEYRNSGVSKVREGSVVAKRMAQVTALKTAEGGGT